jgi:D-alanyl-D-alanine-carboxypeptidase/D-alanyl-D-alanine-endopeptidase
MNTSRCALVLLSLAVTLCVIVPDARGQKLTDQWVEETAAPLVNNHTVDGMSVGYIEGERSGIVHLGSSGQAGQKPNDLSLYEIGSISKVFTSLLLADAVARGAIDLNAAATTVNLAGIRLPAFDGQPITWLNLSTHRSGLPRLPGNLAPTDLSNPYAKYDSVLAAKFLAAYKLPRAPGTSQEYSNFAVSVLGYLLAQKSGRDYQAILKERIADPLQMTDCTISLNADQSKRLATPHKAFGAVTPDWTFADLPGAGGVRATMRDMLRFAQAQLIPPTGKMGEAIELAWKQQTDADKSGPAMGLGWMIAGDGQTRWHNGRTGGSTAAIFVNRQVKCAVVVLSNTSVPDKIDQLATQILLKAAR